MESLTEPPLESSTTVAPASWRPRANSSNSRGLSAVTTPIALIHPLQLGWHVTQLKRIGNLRSSRVTPAWAERPDVGPAPVTARQKATAPDSAKPQNFSDPTSLNLVPSRKPQERTLANSTRHDSVITALSKW
jgi:hypothetical protein